MSSEWSWQRRRTVIRYIVLACWVSYALLAHAALLIFLPPEVKQYWFAYWGIYSVLVLPAAWIHYNWVYNPAYLFGSNGIRRLRCSSQVEAQLSRNANLSNAFGVPRLPANLHTAPESFIKSTDGDRRSQLPVKVQWDTHLYVAARLLRPHDAMPNRTITVDVHANPRNVTLTAGRWRPGIVLDVPNDSIVGTWKGESVATIGTSDVLVIVVDAKNGDEVLLPLAVVRPTKPLSKRDVVDELQRHVNAARRQ